MRFKGTVKSWNDDRGFGFIDPVQGGDEVFFHIKAFSKHNGRPAVGQRVTFEVEVSAQGKKRATNIEAARATASIRSLREERPAAWDIVSLSAIPVLIAVYVGASFLLEGVSAVGSRPFSWQASSRSLLTRLTKQRPSEATGARKRARCSD